MPPSLLFALILALTVGLLFYSIFGRKLWQLPLFLVCAIFGVLGGQVTGTLAGWDLMRVGNVPVVAAVAGALLLLWICWFFTSPLHEGSSGTRRRARRMVSRERRASA